jgi:hypothetical protein
VWSLANEKSAIPEAYCELGKSRFINDSILILDIGTDTCDKLLVSDAVFDEGIGTRQDPILHA